MLDAISKKLLRLLRPDQPAELRRAAALVLPELGVKDAEASQTLCELLDDTDDELRLNVLHAVGRLRVEAALPRLMARAAAGGVEAEAAAQAAVRLGAKGTRGIQQLMAEVAPGLRRRLAGALAAGGTTGAETAAVDALLDGDAGVVDAAARSLIAEVPSLGDAHRQSLADHLLELLKPSRKKPLALASEAALVRLLAAVNDPRAEAVFWERIEPRHAPEVRATALQALGKQTGTPTRDKLKKLLACATDADFRVAAPAMMMLRAVPLSDKNVPDWLALLEAPDVAVRRLALEKVGERDREDVAAALLRQLDHRDRGLREGALGRLARLGEGRRTLAEALRTAATPEQAWLLARAQAPFASEYPTALRQELFEQACTYLEKSDRRADALLFLLREVDARDLRDRLEERALALRKKKQYTRAVLYLRLLGRDPACGSATRLELAACGLKIAEHDLSAEARAREPCLEQFASLLRSHEEEVVPYLEKAKWLEPAELFYLGFHFAEKDGAPQKFGGAVLRLVLQRSPRSQLAKDARSKLRRAGLE